MSQYIFSKKLFVVGIIFGLVVWVSIIYYNGNINNGWNFIGDLLAFFLWGIPLVVLTAIMYGLATVEGAGLWWRRKMFGIISDFLWGFLLATLLAFMGLKFFGSVIAALFYKPSLPNPNFRY